MQNLVTRKDVRREHVRSQKQFTAVAAYHAIIPFQAVTICSLIFATKKALLSFIFAFGCFQCLLNSDCSILPILKSCYKSVGHKVMMH